MKLPSLPISFSAGRLGNLFPTFLRRGSYDNEKPVSPVKRRIIKSIAYTCIGAIAFTLFFVPDYLNNHIDTLLPDLLKQQDAVQITFTNPRFKGYFPPALTADRCRITGKRAAIPPITLESLSLKPALGGLFAGRAGVLFSAQSFGGAISGSIGTGSFSLSSMRVRFIANGIAMEKLPGLSKGIRNLKATSDIDATVLFDPTKANNQLQLLESASGTLNCVIRDASLSNMIPLFTVKTLEIDKLTADLAFEGTRVDLNSMVMDSNVVAGELDGTLNVNPKQLPATVVDLRGNLRPNADHTVLELLDPRAVKMIREGKTISIAISKSLGNAVIKLR